MEDSFNKLFRNYTNVKINDYSISINEIESGIIFLYCTWSPTIIQLKTLFTSLENKCDINLFVFDIDREEALSFFNRQGLHSDGWGETYWIKDGKVISFMKNYNMQSVHELINNNMKITNRTY